MPKLSGSMVENGTAVNIKIPKEPSPMLGRLPTRSNWVKGTKSKIKKFILEPILRYLNLFSFFSDSLHFPEYFY